MANPLQQAPGGGLGSAPLESDSAGTSPWARQSQLGSDPTLFATLMKVWTFVSMAVNDQYTTATVANPNTFVKVTNSSLFCRPPFEAHLFFETQWIFNLVAGGVAPTASLPILIQTWLNNYHVLITPSGIANDWPLNFPPIAANSTQTIALTFLGAIFNVEFRQSGVNEATAPDFHQIDFRYQISSLPSGWSTVQFKPKISMVYAIPTTAVNFTNVQAAQT
jgi:hypothetical protein